jgi:hypothetical protein
VSCIVSQAGVTFFLCILDDVGVFLFSFIFWHVFLRLTVYSRACMKGALVDWMACNVHDVAVHRCVVRVYTTTVAKT